MDKSSPNPLDIMRWDFFNPVKITAGQGILASLPKSLSGFRHALVVSDQGGTQRGVTERVTRLCREASLEVSVCDTITANPPMLQMEELTRTFHARPIDVIVAIGGGSVMDAAKILGVTLPLSNERLGSWVKDLRAGRQTWEKRLPVITIPTTSGTGAEVTPFATIWDTEFKKKYSVLGSHVFPTLTLIDSELTHSLPLNDTLYTGMDAISHALESLWNKNRTPLSVAFATESLRLAIEALPVLLDKTRHEPQPHARAQMAQSATLAGLAISQSKTAIAHSLSYSVTAHFGVPHGLACSFTLPELLRQNRALVVALTRQPEMIERLSRFLQTVDLASHVRRYVSSEGLLALREETLNADRIGNYEGTLECAPFEIITRSMS